MLTFSLGFLLFTAALVCFVVARAVWKSGQ
jgi:hypothetical protein